MCRSQEEEGGVSRRPSLGSQEESGEDSRGVQHQSGRSPVDPVLFKEEPVIEARLATYSAGTKLGSPGDPALVPRRNQVRIQEGFSQGCE